MQIENYWPIPVYTNIHDNEDLRQTVLDYFLSIKHQRFNASDLGNIATQYGDQPSLNNNNVFLEDVPWCKQVLEEVVSEALFALWKQIQPTNLIVPSHWKVRGWFVGYEKENSFQSIHFHKNCSVSGVWYLQNNDPLQGPLEIVNPMLSSCYNGYRYSHQVEAIQNLSVCFPSFLQHYAHPVKDSKKISLAWDAEICNGPEDNCVTFEHQFI